MKDVMKVMQDVSVLVTRGSDAARREAQRVAAEPERRTAHRPAGAALTAPSGDRRPTLSLRLVRWLPRAWPRPF